MHESENQRDPKSGRPPYLFLIPVAIAVVGFTGYQTVRMATDVRAVTPIAGLDPSDSQALLLSGVITVHPHARPTAAQRVAALPPALPSPTPVPSRSPRPSPSLQPAQSPSPTVSAGLQKNAVDDARKAATAHAADVASAVHAHRIAVALAATAAAEASGAREARPIAVRAALNFVPQNSAGQSNAALAQAPSSPSAIAFATGKPAPAADTAAGDPAVNAADRIVDAKMSYAATPDYPEIARGQGAHGTSVVFVTVDERGTVKHVSVANSSGFVALDRAAVDAARGSRYVPPKVDGHPATETYRVTYDFSP